MRTEIKIVLAVAAVGILAKLFMGGGAGRDEIAAALKKGALIVDVRTPGEFAGGHAEGAVNIPYDSISREIGSLAAGKERSIVLYCHSGARAAVAKRALAREGYINVLNAATLGNIRKVLNQ
jgi:phage shock protein E